MKPKELEKWILNQRNKGFTDEEIRDLLRQEGINEAKINQAFSELKNSNQKNNGRYQGNNLSQDEDSSVDQNNSEEDKDSYTEFDIVEAVKNGLRFLTTRQAIVGFGYLTGAILLLFLTSIGVNHVSENGPLLGVIGMAPLGLIFLAELFLVGYSYVKFFRIILKGVGVQLEPLSTLGVFLAILRLGVGTIIYIISIIAGLIFLIFPGIYLGVVLFFWNYGVMRGEGLISSFKHSFEIATGNALKLFGLSFTVSIISSAVSAIFRLPAEVLSMLGYTNVGGVVSVPGLALSSMVTISIMGTAYAMLLDVKDRKDAQRAKQRNDQNNQV